MKASKKSEKPLRQVWLAGVGTSGKGADLLSDKLDKVVDEGSALFNTLIARGESVESQLFSKLKNTTMIEKRLAELKAKLGFHSQSRENKLNKLSTQVDKLIDTVTDLAEKKARQASTAKAADKQNASQSSNIAEALGTKPTGNSAAESKAAKSAELSAQTVRKETTSRVAKSASTTTAAKAPVKRARKPVAKATPTVNNKAASDDANAD